MEHTVLVVEDEKGIRESLKLFLKSHNYEVVEAENGAEALKKISPDIHLAIVDIMMPVMDGMTFVSRLRESYDFPVIFLSAKDEDIDKITGLNIGADDYVTKPFEP
ncbi:MAG TPA: DNA-binding response regulator, partial [Erysipelotrichaceae bacterium]|nr:DNA-binding response regulator [Erysipelotrichaceae bacterium]